MEGAGKRGLKWGQQGVDSQVIVIEYFIIRESRVVGVPYGCGSKPN
jgi:hypothetical protein